MKLTKGMKKALSVLLVGAMVITGANVTTKTADAKLVVKGTSVMKWTGEAKFGNSWDSKDIELTTDEGSSENVQPAGFVTSEGWGASTIAVLNVTGIQSFTDPSIAVVASETSGEAQPFAVCYAADDEDGAYKGWDIIASDDAAKIGLQKDDKAAKVASDVTVITGKLNKNVEKYYWAAQDRTVTAIYVYDAADITDANEDGSIIDELAAYEAPQFATEMADFTATFGTTGSLKEASVNVTGDGVYALTAQDDDTGFTGGFLGIETDVLKQDLIPGFSMKLLALAIETAANGKITTTVVNAVEGKDDFCFADSDDKKPVRVQILNQWASYTDATGVDTVGDPGIDAFDGAVEGWDENATITAYFEVSGMGKTAEKSVEVPEAGTTEKDDPNYVAPTPTPGNTVAPTSAPSTKGAVATKSAVASPATVKLSVAKKNKNVVVAAGKTKTVAFTAKAQAPATKAAVVTASVKGNKKVTAKIDGSKVKIKAAKKAVKGSAATVTLTSKNASGAAVKATIKVKVQNKAKKIKAAKKSVSIKKGKTAKVTIKVTKAENKKKAVTDTVTAKIKKIAKVTKTQVKKGKVIITLKAKKKGSAKLTVKVGKKAAKVNVKVK